jgi:hypothetical protein
MRSALIILPAVIHSAVFFTGDVTAQLKAEERTMKEEVIKKGQPAGGETPQAKQPEHRVLHISVHIDCPPDEVYAFVSNPANLPKWATGLGGSIRQVNGEWVADAPMGKVKIRFAERNRFGVLDHDVILESGVSIHNPMRVVRSGNGSEVTFMLFRREGVSDKEFSADAEWVEKDLRILKKILEE